MSYKIYINQSINHWLKQYLLVTFFSPSNFPLSLILFFFFFLPTWLFITLGRADQIPGMINQYHTSAMRSRFSVVEDQSPATPLSTSNFNIQESKSPHDPLPPAPPAPAPASDPMAVALYDMQETEGALGFSAGERMVIKERRDDGWWFAEISPQRSGWVYSEYVQLL